MLYIIRFDGGEGGNVADLWILRKNFPGMIFEFFNFLQNFTFFEKKN